MEKYRLSPSYLRRRNSYRKNDHEDDFGYSRWKRWSAQTFTSQRQSNLSFILSVSSERRITHRANEQWINEARFSSHAFKSNHMSLICIASFASPAVPPCKVGGLSMQDRGLLYHISGRCSNHSKFEGAWHSIRMLRAATAVWEVRRTTCACVTRGETDMC